MTTLGDPTVAPVGLNDGFRRTINYMRISVTDRCNLRCLYCMPEQGVPWILHEDILSYEEITRIVEATAELGMRRLRITGGEPLVRKNLHQLIAMLAAIPGIDDVALSTNAILLPDYAHTLASAGLRRVNVSLDTLNPDTFGRLTRRDDLQRALAGIGAALDAGLTPIKINCVAVRGFNDAELPNMAALTLEHPYHVRFIELMPLHSNAQWQPDWFISTAEIVERLGVLGELEPCAGPEGNGPARYFRLPGAKGTIGVISPMTHTYCASCNRVRLTADGQLRLCLFDDHQVDLRTPLRRGASAEELQEIFREAILRKPEHHNLSMGQSCSSLHGLWKVGG